MRDFLSLGLLILLTMPALAQQARPVPVDQPVQSLFERNPNPRKLADTAAEGRGVVSAADPRAAEAGLEMLRRGGSATDAALAMAFALTVVEPQSSGLGGGAFYVAHDARTGRIETIDGREVAPAAARPDRFLGADGKPLPQRQAVESGRSVGVPGLVALAAKAHSANGRLPWATLFEPAIRLARDGWTLSPRFVRTLGVRARMVGNTPAAALFYGPDGKPLPIGTHVRAPRLAQTFEAIAAGGSEAFYAGPLANEIAHAVSADPRGGGGMTAADLAAYRPVARQPVCGGYRGWRVCGMGPPATGAVAVIQILGQLQRFDLAKLGRDNPLAWHLIAESMRLALADREAWMGDPAFAPVPTDGLVDPAYIAARSALIRTDRAMPSVSAGLPPGAPPPPFAGSSGGGGTSAMVAADRDGNVVTLTSTIESIFGSGLMAGGFFLNNELTDFDFIPERGGRPSPNRVEAGKRPRSSMAPILLYSPDGRLKAALGAAGGTTIIAQVAKTAIAIIDWKLPPEVAIAEPVIFAGPGRFAYERGTRLDGMVAAWAALGHEPQPADLPLKANAIVRNGTKWRAAGDYRSEGEARAIR